MNSCVRLRNTDCCTRAARPTGESIRKLGERVEGASPVRLPEFRGLFLPPTRSVSAGELINLSDLQAPFFTKCRCCGIYPVGPLRRPLKASDPYFVSSENILLLSITPLQKP